MRCARATWIRRLALPGLVAMVSATCLFPTGDQRREGVLVYQVEVIQRLEALEGYAAVGAHGLREATRCDSTATAAAPRVTCTWRIPRPDFSARFDVDPPVDFRLGDRVIVRARLGSEGAAGTEVLVRLLGEGQQGPSALRVVADTLDLLSVGETRLAVYAAGYPDAVPDTLTLFTYPARLPPKCGTQSSPACALDSLLVGEVLEIPGGPFGAVRDPATGTVLAVLPEPSVTIGGLPAPVLERTDTLLRVAVPAGGSPSGTGLLRVTILGLPAVCTPSILDDCYRAVDYAFQDWDVLEPDSAASPTDLALAQGDSVLAWHPALALEGKATPWALDATGRAQDWYTFTLDAPTAVQVEITSAVPIDLQLSDALAWDAGRAQARVVPGGWAVGSRPACQGVELALAFPEADRGGVKRMTAALDAGRHHLAVSSTGPLPSMVGYGLRLVKGDMTPSDDSRCESAVPFSEGVTGRLDGSFDVDWFVTTPTDSVYTEFLASSYLGEVPGVAVLRDRLPDSLPVIAQGDGRSVPLLTPERHLIALLGNGRTIPYTLITQPTTWGPPAALELAGLPGSAAVCEAWDVTVTVRDRLGNRVLGYAGTVGFGATDPGASLPAAYTFTAADSGRHRFANGVAFQNEGAATVTVSEQGAAGLTGNATVTVTPPALRVAVDPAVATVGVGEQVAFTATVSNTCGASVSAPVTWASVNPARATMTANVATGVASGQVTLRADAGDRPTYVHLTVTAPRPTTAITWDSVIGTTAGENLRDVWAAGPAAAWAVGTPGLIMQYDGSTWTTVRSTGIAADTLFGVWGTGAGDVWAVGTGGTVLHFDGSTWTTLDAETNRTLRNVWAASPDDVWIVGDAGTVLRYDGLEFEIVPVAEFPSSNLREVWGRTPTEVWIGGSEGDLRLHDGTSLTTLSHRDSPGGVNSYFVTGPWGVAPTDVRYWVVCQAPPGTVTRCGAGGQVVSDLFAWNGTQIIAPGLPPVPEGTEGSFWLGVSVLGTDATEAWYLTTRGLVVGTSGNWTTLLSRLTVPPPSCQLVGGVTSDLMMGMAAGAVSLPGDIWIVGTCYDGNSFRSFILRGRY